MYDNIKISIKEKHSFEEIIYNEFPDFNFTINNGEIKNKKNTNASIYPIKGNIDSMSYVINKHTAYIESSLHKYYNLAKTQENINYNNFTFCQAIESLERFRKTFKSYDFSDTKITSLEFGFNIKMESSVKEIIEKNFLLYKFRPHYVYENKKDFIMKKFKSGNYLFKIYDKGRQNNLDYELIRIEIKYNSKELKKLKIIDYYDLYEPEKVKNLFNDFKEKFEHFIIVDTRFNNKLSKQEIESIGNKLEYSYWKRKDISYSTKYRHKKQFFSLLKEKGLTNISELLKEKISQKINLLSESCKDLNNLLQN
ncbi:hypothetical protein KRX57_06640 [Weeksellaceae bacterium TAE3-ERU29]|nr:hypothetical protein [Weeksellaceae bacterium TAE3-ERU29]